MSLIIRYVDLSSRHVCIEESFIGYLDVKKRLAVRKRMLVSLRGVGGELGNLKP
jgi:hypothetical protein